MKVEAEKWKRDGPPERELPRASKEDEGSTRVQQASAALAGRLRGGTATAALMDPDPVR